MSQTAFSVQARCGLIAFQIASRPSFGDTNGMPPLVPVTPTTGAGHRSANRQISVVGRTDFNGQPRLLFRNVSEDGRLDITPRLDAILNPHPEYGWRFDGYVAEHEETTQRTIYISIGLFVALYGLLVATMLPSTREASNLTNMAVTLIAVGGVLAALILVHLLAARQLFRMAREHEELRAASGRKPRA